MKANRLTKKALAEMRQMELDMTAGLKAVFARLERKTRGRKRGWIKI